MDNRKKLAVFTANIYEPMVKAIQDGIKTAALEENIKVFYFTSFSDKFSSKVYSQYERYDKGDVVSFLLPDLDDFDGVIRVSFAYGTYTEKKLDEMIDTLNIPILNVGGKHDTFRYVSNDEQKSFMDIVEHVITGSLPIGQFSRNTEYRTMKIRSSTERCGETVARMQSITSFPIVPNAARNIPMPSFAPMTIQRSESSKPAVRAA